MVSIIKKKDRPSPSASATEYPVGKKMKGNDGKMWVVIRLSNKTKRWVTVASQSGSKTAKPKKIRSKNIKSGSKNIKSGSKNIKSGSKNIKSGSKNIKSGSKKSGSKKTKSKKPYSKLPRLISKTGEKLRPSPNISATEVKVGTKKIGNDKNIWIVEKGSNGVSRWVKYNANSEPINLRKFKKVGKYEQISSGVIISDPGYDVLGKKYLNSITNVISRVLPGTWLAYVKIYQGRVSQLLVFHEDYDPSILKFKKTTFGQGVDSGQMAIVDKKYYRDDEIGEEFFSSHERKVTKKWKRPVGLGETWYQMCCEITIPKQAGIVQSGAVSRTGWGDGFYPSFYARGKGGHKVAFWVSFIVEGLEFD
jgi:hypothetical protein